MARTADVGREATTADAVRVRRAGPADLPATRSVLARALAPDPLMDWIFAGHPHREAAVAAFLWAPIEAYVVAGTVWLATDGTRAVGAAAWSVPAAAGATAADGGPVLPGDAMGALLLPPEHLAVVREGFAAMHGQLPDEPHALLHLLGVDADRRGEGIGVALVASALAELPGDLPAHVNTTVDANVRFYEARGFVHAGAVRLGERGPTMHALRRPAAGPAVGPRV
ncbi:GNAT family N-acetyltransferase [Cellulomonas sp. NS3]|uniref:GNAT family N-acetyltransferase n=1 Tax=Cellulomonas sp. NS3 TaxID=2973977 RepID=UPI00216297A3|nr:GNAT family N-acetyltransferase [Cellulomonas sp. NS3]